MWKKRNKKYFKFVCRIYGFVKSSFKDFIKMNCDFKC